MSDFSDQIDERTTVFAVRGAVQLETDSVISMREAVTELLGTLCRQNDLHEDDIISIQFTQTSDLVQANPARELRSSGFENVSLFCSLEPDYPESLERTLRVLVTYRSSIQHKPSAVYLGKTLGLRSIAQ
ncbi:chorismate mutase [Spirochaeta dissipatitropha]